MKDKLKSLLFNSKIRGYTNKNLAYSTLYAIMEEGHDSTS